MPHVAITIQVYGKKLKEKSFSDSQGLVIGYNVMGMFWEGLEEAVSWNSIQNYLKYEKFNNI